jgi:hypothetical protein
MCPKLKRASFVLWDNITTKFTCQSPLFKLTIQLSDAGAYLFTETINDFSITASHPIRVHGNLMITVDRVGYGQGYIKSSNANLSSTNVTLALPSSSQLLGASVTVLCKKNKSVRSIVPKARMWNSQTNSKSIKDRNERKKTGERLIIKKKSLHSFRRFSFSN